MEKLLAVSDMLADAAKSKSNVFAYLDPEIPDITNNSTVDLVLCLQDTEIRITLEQENLPFLLTSLHFTLFSKERKILCWNFKNFFSYVLKHTGKPFKLEAALLDLKILEAYLGSHKTRPESLEGAMARVRTVFNEGGLESILGIYKRIYLPLITQVVPSMEACGLPNRVRESFVYAYYGIEGQRNGRFLCHNAYMNSFNPHSMGIEERGNILPIQDHIFMYFDYRNMEVAVLQWLSGDSVLGEVLKNEDVYGKIWEMVVGRPMNQDRDEFGKIIEREKAKKLFLPIIYGQSANLLSERLSIKLVVAEQISKRIRELFSVAVKFVESHQNEAISTKWSKDRFGRKREFTEKEYKARNFAVQSPASLICLDKLVSLYKSFNKIAFYVHDGYVILATKDNWKTVYKMVKSILEAESDLAPGLKLYVDCNAGKSLADLKSVLKKRELE